MSFKKKVYLNINIYLWQGNI